MAHDELPQDLGAVKSPTPHEPLSLPGTGNGLQISHERNQKRTIVKDFS